MDVRRDLICFLCCRPCIRIAAMTTLTSASLLRDSVVGSSGCMGTVATCERLDRRVCASGGPLRLSGLVSDEMLGDREMRCDVGRDKWSDADGGLESE